MVCVGISGSETKISHKRFFLNLTHSYGGVNRDENYQMATGFIN